MACRQYQSDQPNTSWDYRGLPTLACGNGLDTYIIDSDDKGIVRDKNGQEIAGIFIKQAEKISNYERRAA